jgi:hypothetical protein
MAPYLVRYEGQGKPCVLHTLLGPVVMFGEPRQKSLDTFSAPVSNMAVTILAASNDMQQAFKSKIIASAPVKSGGPQPPRPPPLSGSSNTPKANMSNTEILKILATLTAQLSMGNAAQGANQAKVAMPVADDIIRTLSYLVAPAWLFHPLSPDKKFLVNTVFDTCAEGCFLTECLATILGLTGTNQPQILKLLSMTVTGRTVREIQRSTKPPNLDDLKKRFPSTQDGAPLYSERQRQEQRDHFDTVSNALDLHINFDNDDLLPPAKSADPRPLQPSVLGSKGEEIEVVTCKVMGNSSWFQSLL